MYGPYIFLNFDGKPRACQTTSRAAVAHRNYEDTLEDFGGAALARALAGKGGVTQDEFERSLVTATSKMEANLQVSERSATHSHLWPRTYKPV